MFHARKLKPNYYNPMASDLSVTATELGIFAAVNKIKDIEELRIIAKEKWVIAYKLSMASRDLVADVQDMRTQDLITLQNQRTTIRKLKQDLLESNFRLDQLLLALDEAEA